MFKKNMNKNKNTQFAISGGSRTRQFEQLFNLQERRTIAFKDI